MRLHSKILSHFQEKDRLGSIYENFYKIREHIA